MLSHADGALVARARDLPGLGLVLDDERFGERLKELIPDLDVRSARAVYLRYRPPTRCVVAYRVRGRAGELDVHAVAWARSATEKLARARARAERAAPPRLWVLEDVAVVVAVFPEDRQLRVLARLVKPRAGRELLTSLLGRDPGRDAPLLRLRYKPERRWVGRLALGGGPRAVVKAYAAEGFEAALRGSRAWVDRPPLRVPKLLGALPERGLLALEWIEGRPLGEALLDGQAEASDVTRAGEALASLHRQRASRLLARTPRQHARHVRAVAAALGFVQPALAARAERLGREVAERLEARPGGTTPVHGDFNADQVLLADGAAALIDFDEAALAEPAVDLGAFVADLERRACAGRLPRGRAEALGQALLEGYARKAEPAARAELALHTAAALLSLAPHFFRERDPRWPEQTEAVLDRVESVLAGRATAPAPAERQA